MAKGGVRVICGREGNHRSDAALVMRHRQLFVFIIAPFYFTFLCLSVVRIGASVFMQFSLIFDNCMYVCRSISISSIFILYFIYNQSSLMATKLQ